METDLSHLNRFLEQMGGIQRHIEAREYTITRVRRTPAKNRKDSSPWQFWATFADNSRLPDWYAASTQDISKIHHEMCIKWLNA